MPPERPSPPSPEDPALLDSSGNAPTLAAPAAPSATGRQVEVGGEGLEDRGFAARYEAGPLLGRGGMGEVHLCRDLRTGRRVALKRAQPGVGSGPDAQGRLRFIREARIQAQLEHPAVVPVYDLGVDPSGAEYFTMRRVRGRTLAALLDELRRGQADAARVARRRLLGAFCSVCLAIDYAHSRGVVHRDLKPANIMLGDFGEVSVLDWGLAKIAGDPAPGTPALEALEAGTAGDTVAGSILGTPGYAAPELLRAEPAEQAADVYSLGAILFELLTLDPLHRGEGTRALIEATLTGADARASLRAPHQEVPPELEALCVRATALRPEDRAASARELAETVERFLDGDRDLALRRAQAQEAADSAARAADSALGPSTPLSERQRALREVGRALGLDPTNQAAAQTLVRLLTAPPHPAPPAAEAELREAMRDRLRASGRMGTIAYAGVLAFIPALLAFGMKISGWFWLCLALFMGLIVASAAVARARRPTLTTSAAVLALSTLAFAATSGLFGPYVLLPTLLAVNTMAFAFHASGYRLLLIGCAGFLGPVVLEGLHVLPPSLRISGGIVQLMPRMVEFRDPGTQVMLVVMNLAAIAGAAIYALHFQRVLAGAQRQLHLQAWQLRQLVTDRGED